MKKTEYLLDQWIRFLPKFLTGQHKTMEQRYIKLYGKKDCSEKIKMLRRKTAKKYILIFLMIIVLAAANFIAGSTTPDGSVISKDGEIVRIVRPSKEDGTKKIDATLQASDESGTLTQKVTLAIRPEAGDAEAEIVLEEAASPRDATESELKRLIKIINKSEVGESVVLPAEIEGFALSWKEREKSNIPIIALGLLLGLCITFRNRYTSIEKEEAKAKESIIRELPEWINKIVLLLNAGMVLTSAFSRILEDYSRGRKEVESYFYEQLLQINKAVQETNSPMAAEFRDFARRSGVKELMRLSNIITDNIDKGAAFVEKLQGESELLWFARKKQAEEKGRLAETKMTFPLVILLLVLITVTVSPALMEM